jgi:dihydroflavonol-4-reductase
MLTVVTGASGHLGGNLVRRILQDGHQVRVIVHSNSRSIEGLPVEKVNGNILEIESLNSAFLDADVVFHLAARVSISGKDTKEVEAINVTGVQNVVAACIANRVKKLVHISSIHAHQQTPLNQAVDETRPLVGLTHKFAYDRTKAQGEAIVSQAVANGLNAVILNPTCIIGPYDSQPSHFGAAIIMMAKGKIPVAIGGGFDWVDARDVADGAIRAARMALPGGKYMISGHWVSMKDVAREVSFVMKKRPPSFVLPIWSARGVVPFAGIYYKLTNTRPLFTKAAICAIDGNRNICHDKASRTFGYQPRPFRETIIDTVTWFKENGYLD